MSTWAHVVTQHGPHAAEIGVPAAYIGWVVWRERRRSYSPPALKAVDEDRLPARVQSVALWLIVAATAADAAIHASVSPQHFEEGTIYGVFFAVLAAAQLSMAAMIGWKRDPRIIAVLGAADAATIALWLLTRVWGIPGGPESGRVEPFGSRDILASALELLTVVAAAFLLSPRLNRRPARVYRAVGRVGLYTAFGPRRHGEVDATQ